MHNYSDYIFSEKNKRKTSNGGKSKRDALDKNYNCVNFALWKIIQEQNKNFTNIYILLKISKIKQYM